eukprot:1004962-Pleurochrysis_carterae.AAC.4
MIVEIELSEPGDRLAYCSGVVAAAHAARPKQIDARHTPRIAALAWTRTNLCSALEHGSSTLGFRHHFHRHIPLHSCQDEE